MPLLSREQSRPQVGENAVDIFDEDHFGCRMLEALLGTVVESGRHIVPEADALCIAYIKSLVGAGGWICIINTYTSPLDRY